MRDHQTRQDLIISCSAWTTAAVDTKRVIGAVPIVMDLINLNIVKQFFIDRIDKYLFQ